MAHWRDTMRPLKFFGLDARAAVLWVVVILNPSKFMFGLLIITTAVFFVMQRYGLMTDSALRYVRGWLIGRWRPATVTAARRKMNHG